MTEKVGTSHPRCERPQGHTCQRPSGRACIERGGGCDSPAGTLWGPLWCPEHDADRLDNVSRGMESLLAPSFPPEKTEADEKGMVDMHACSHPIDHRDVGGYCNALLIGEHGYAKVCGEKVS